MHGLMFVEFRRYVIATHGERVWTSARGRLQAPPRSYLTGRVYPDAEFKALLQATATLLARDPLALQEEFGVFLAPELARFFAPQIDPSWDALDLMEHVEDIIHSSVRRTLPGATPPRFRVTRSGPDVLRLEYESSRQMCGIARGIARGVGIHFGQPLEVSETHCRRRGGSKCEFLIRPAAPSAGPVPNA